MLRDILLEAMTEEKICPVMSRPKDGDSIETPDDMKECVSRGWTIINNVPWGNIFYCQRERCMAWKQDGTHGFCKLIGVT